MKRNLVVYYSWQGNTKAVAEEVANAAGGDLLRIEELKERKSGVGFMTAAMGALFGLKSRLKPFGNDLSGYDNIFLGAQVWAGHSTPPINAFINKTDFTNKNVYIFITKADEKVPQKVIDSITKRIVKKGGRVLDALSVTTKMNEVIKTERVRQQVSEWVQRLTF